jgi:hypothetical protein
MRLWMDTVLDEFTRMTWQGWIVDLVGGCGLGWLVYLYCGPSNTRRKASPTRRRSRRHVYHLRVQRKVGAE